MANSKFVQAVKRAKGLYKSGRYKTFADAVKAAYKKGKSVSSVAGKKVSGKKTKVRVSVGAVGKSRKKSMRQLLEDRLGKSYVRFVKATTIKATNKERKVIAETKAKLKKL